MSLANGEGKDRSMNVKDQMQTVLDELGFDFRNFTMTNFVSWLEAHKGRRIFFLSGPMPVNMYGAWFSDSEYPHEYFFFDHTVPTIHQVHIQLHELSHYICGHKTLQITGAKLKSLIFALKENHAYPVEFMELARHRAPDQANAQEEAEAETLAMLIQERVIKFARMNELSKTVSSHREAANFLRDMGVP